MAKLPGSYVGPKGGTRNLECHRILLDALTLVVPSNVGKQRMVTKFHRELGVSTRMIRAASERRALLEDGKFEEYQRKARCDKVDVTWIYNATHTYARLDTNAQRRIAIRERRCACVT